MRADEEKIIEVHRQYCRHGYADYGVEIRESNEKQIVTIRAGKVYRFEFDKHIAD